ncbi:MAG TPA: hypothetical protein VF503_19055 [Sphingobium sp.]|uniref:hypothetical protein n=1 Tax=Sphingobium sp. TaxID=1912891 RepID=UPI002ED444DA
MSTTSDFYLARAAESAREAQAAGLDNVRDRNLRAEAAWLVMADRSLKMETERRHQAADKATRVEEME